MDSPPRPYPDTNVEWLIAEYDVYSQRAFAWCDLGVGHGELGWVWMPEVCALDIERRDGVHLQAQFDADFVPRTFGEIDRASP